MSKLQEWSIADKINASGKRGVIIGLAIATFVVLIVVLVSLKMYWAKKQAHCCCDMDDIDDYYLDEDDLDDLDDEDGIGVAGDSDFAK